MKATIDGIDTISGRTIQDIRVQLCRMLRVEGPRTISAITDRGTEIVVSLYEDQDRITRKSMR